LRIDQVMMTCLQYFLPISCVLLVGVCLWQLLVPAEVTNIVKLVLAFGCVSLGLAVILSLFRAPPGATAPPGQLPGVWEGKPAPVASKAS
jgi:NADH-quinone oxidoreductase subunit H